jgi:hypothetical protein
MNALEGVACANRSLLEAQRSPQGGYYLWLDRLA